MLPEATETQPFFSLGWTDLSLSLSWSLRLSDCVCVCVCVCLSLALSLSMSLSLAQHLSLKGISPLLQYFLWRPQDS